MRPTNLLRLLQLSDPALPIGGFSHSAGLETYVQQGLVKDVGTAKAFVEGQLLQNLSCTDAAFVSLAYDAAEANNVDVLLLLDEECNAVKLPKEMRQASQKLGGRLLKIFIPLQDDERLKAFAAAVRNGEAAGHYCVAFGIMAAVLGITKADALTGFFYNAAAGMVTNCVKLIPLGQGQGQALLFSLHELIEGLAQKAMNPDREMIGFCCTGFDIRCMQHEDLYSRLYMS